MLYLLLFSPAPAFSEVYWIIVLCLWADIACSSWTVASVSWGFLLLEAVEAQDEVEVQQAGARLYWAVYCITMAGRGRGKSTNGDFKRWSQLTVPRIHWKSHDYAMAMKENESHTLHCGKNTSRDRRKIRTRFRNNADWAVQLHCSNQLTTSRRRTVCYQEVVTSSVMMLHLH